MGRAAEMDYPRIISERPFVELLSAPYYNEKEKRHEALANYEGMLVIVEVSCHF